MYLPPTSLSLTSTAVIDLQLHTAPSDGDWTDEQLLDYPIAEGFGLTAVTDHDRADTAPRLPEDKMNPVTTKYETGLKASLGDPEEAAAYLNAALEENDQEVFLLALRYIAEARGFSRVLKK